MVLTNGATRDQTHQTNYFMLCVQKQQDSIYITWALLFAEEPSYN